MDRRFGKIDNNMTVLKICKYPDPVLKKKAAAVVSVTAETKTLIRNMLETLRSSSNGVGLAANQVGVPLRIIVLSGKLIDASRNDFVLINPVIVKKKGKKTEEEGCLSVPGIYFKLKRANYVKLTANTENGKMITIEGEGLLSRAIQHEIDHVNGKILIDRLPLLKRLRTIRQIKRKIKEGLW